MEISVDIFVATLLFLLTGERVYNFLRSRGVDLASLCRRVEDLWEWHRETDSNGVKRMYFREDARRAILNMDNRLRDVENHIERMEQMLEEIWRNCISQKEEDA